MKADVEPRYGVSGRFARIEARINQLRCDDSWETPPRGVIKVTGGDHIWFEQPITVQVKEDDIVTFCNHAGHEPGIFYIDDQLRSTGELCDKCEAWSYDGEEWHE